MIQIQFTETGLQDFIDEVMLQFRPRVLYSDIKAIALRHAIEEPEADPPEKEPPGWADTPLEPGVYSVGKGTPSEPMLTFVVPAPLAQSQALDSSKYPERIETNGRCEGTFIRGDFCQTPGKCLETGMCQLNQQAQLVPRCPRCGKNVSYAIGGTRVYCKDAAHEFEIDTFADLAQFFRPSPPASERGGK